MKLFGFFRAVGRLMKKAFGFAKARGLDDELIDLALSFVVKADVKFADKAERREWVVSQVMAHAGKHVPENVARAALVFAFELFKKR